MIIGVIGAGVIGLSTAIRLQVNLSTSLSDIIIISENVSPNITSFTAAGLWHAIYSSGTKEVDARLVYRSGVSILCVRTLIFHL